MFTRRFPAILVCALILISTFGLTSPAAASGPCALFFIPPFPPFNWVIICKPFPKLTAEPECLELIDEEDVILCPPGSVSSPPNVIIAPAVGSQPVFAMAMGFTHPNPSTPDDVFAVACDNQINDCDGWTMKFVPQAVWDEGAFAFGNDGVWSPPALGSFASYFPNSDYALVFMADQAGAAPLLAGQWTSFTLYGLLGDAYPYALFGDGAVTASGTVTVFDPVVPNEAVDWSEIKATYR